jgi:hypothetical protein
MPSVAHELRCHPSRLKHLINRHLGPLLPPRHGLTKLAVGDTHLKLTCGRNLHSLALHLRAIAPLLIANLIIDRPE